MVVYHISIPMYLYLVLCVAPSQVFLCPFPPHSLTGSRSVTLAVRSLFAVRLNRTSIPLFSHSLKPSSIVPGSSAATLKSESFLCCYSISKCLLFLLPACSRPLPHLRCQHSGDYHAKLPSSSNEPTLLLILARCLAMRTPLWEATHSISLWTTTPH